MCDMRSYLDLINKNGELAVVKKKVSPKFEIAAVTAKMDGSKALLFENVKDSKFRVVSNLVGTRKRFAHAVGTVDTKIHEKVISAIKHASKPKITTKAKFMENQSRDLFTLPIVTHFDKEPGPFITSSIIYTKNQEMGTQNSSFNRLLRIDEKHFSIRMVEGRHLHRTFVYAKEHGEDLKIAISVGVHPAISIAGAYQADWGKDELEIANELLGKKLTLFKSPYSQMLVPSESEIIIEGRILKDRTHKEWMVEMLRTYDFKRAQPVFELDRIYFRNNPIFHDILAGLGEHQLLMGMPIEAKINKELKQALPQTRNVVLTEGGCKWLHAVVQISKKRDSDPKKAIDAAFSAHRSLKNVVIVDDDIDPSDPVAVEYAMATRFQADKDLVIVPNVRGSSLDPSSDQKNLRTTKMGVDATKPFSKRAEGFEIAKIPGEENISLKKYFK
ncbi:MAG: UbiD family decarboxylase [Thaumarchaeota archaeon]|nr:UbiD family decarboxylase [Nitrososphaerota archaeon]MDE1830943.1 UbiD family decarboxylase [Nitrososphaerota archaeon]MDE1877793.1 UbiD family decarboxylase [Nitrososphaerota archaeon]